LPPFLHSFALSGGRKQSPDDDDDDEYASNASSKILKRVGLSAM
jgi:hypothetical protein